MSNFHRWPVHPLPYLNAIHASSITCVTHVSDVDNIVMSKIVSGSNADSNKSSRAPWPGLVTISILYC